MKKEQPKNSLVKTKQSSDVANTLYERIASVIRDARVSIMRSVDTTMVKVYWFDSARRHQKSCGFQGIASP